ncbi:MAG: multicomponent Na+:H+ antiporter subunit D [Verrucomicrobiales bacterium]|jgi:multicomponent Na+:H+ antiporter subunit D
MTDLPQFPPALILILGALLVPFLKGSLKNIWTILLPAAALLYIWLGLKLPEVKNADGEMVAGSLSGWMVSLRGLGDLTWFHADKLTKAFGYIFTINAIAAFWFAFHLKKSTQHTAALIYIGSALGVIFSGDLITTYVFWEIMAVASTFVILARNTSRARGAAYRYVLIHIFGGLLFLAGLVMHIAGGGDIGLPEGLAGILGDGEKTLGMWLILGGFLVNAAAPPLHAWLSDAYPEASVSGGLILSAYTTKTAVYTLLRWYPGWEELIWVGCIMTVFGIIYALLENDMRRILAYSIINQVGFMVCAAGIGTEQAISGATAHAFCHIIYKSLLWMSAGAVLYRVGKSKCTELGGLYKTMPLTLIFGTIGALAISAVPLTSGFTSKTIIIEQTHLDPSLFWAWLMLEIASAGVFLHAGIKFPYFVFFNKDRGLRPKEAPKSMLIPMAFLSLLCIVLAIPGLYQHLLWDLLPYPVTDFNPYGVGKIIHQMQLLMFAGLVFFLFLPMLKRTDTISLDTDWFWRKGGRGFAWMADKSLNGFNQLTGRTILGKVIPGLARFFRDAPSKVARGLMTPVWLLTGQRGEALKSKRSELRRSIRTGASRIGVTACFAVVLLAILFLIRSA